MDGSHILKTCGIVILIDTSLVPTAGLACVLWPRLRGMDKECWKSHSAASGPALNKAQASPKVTAGGSV